MFIPPGLQLDVIGTHHHISGQHWRCRAGRRSFGKCTCVCCGSKKRGQQSQVFNRLLSVSCGCMSRMLHMEYFLQHPTTTKTTETMQEQIAHDIPNVLDSLAFFPHFRKETLTSKSTPSPLLSQTQPSRCLIIHMQSQAVSDSIVRV